MKTTSFARLSLSPAAPAISFPILVMVALLAFAGSLRAETHPRTFIRWTGTGWDSRQSFLLEWPALSNATYLVQSATDLATTDAWQTMDLVTPTNGAGQYEIKGRSIPENSAEFFRLILPSPQIFSVEPAILPPGVAVDAVVIGQCFETNDVVQVDGAPASGVVYLSGNLLQGSLPPFPAGSHVVQLVRNGVVVSSFTVTCADALANPERVLQGPPTEPPASPSARSKQSEVKANLKSAYTAQLTGGAGDPLDPDSDDDGVFLSKRGYDYYKAQSDMASAGLQNNPAFQENSNQGQMPRALLALWLSKKGYDYYQAQSALSFEVQEGKKGLNAVNVKLARTAGGIAGGVVAGIVVGAVVGALGADGGDCDDSDPIFMSAHKEFKGHVSLLKRSDNGGSAAARGGHTKSGHVSLLKRGDAGVSPFSGEVEACVVDLAIPGRELDFVWARTYHSRLGRTGAATNGWTFSYDVSCAQNSSGGIDVFDGTGRQDTFTLGTNGVYTCPELFREGTLSNNTFTLTFADTGRWVFQPFDNSPTAGLVHQVITRNGSVITLSHNAASGRLTQIVDDLGRTNTVDYDTFGRLARLTDFSGRPVSYEYDVHGDLVACVSPPVVGTPNGNDFPEGKTNRYSYTSGYPLALDRQNHLLLACVDALGQTTMQFTYDLSAVSASYLRCTAVQEGAHPPSVFYSIAAHELGHTLGLQHTSDGGIMLCIVNDPLGNVTECYFDARGRCVAEREFTGRATPGIAVTDTVNRPKNKVRQSDPDYYQAQWTWNNDSLCTSETAPGGQRVECVYECDFDPATAARKRADCRVVRELAASPVDLDGDGLADMSERVWRFEYDPRFGSSGTRAQDHNSSRSNKTASGIDTDDDDDFVWGIVARKGWDGSVKKRVAIKTKGTGADKNRSVTFGREKLTGLTGTKGDFNLATHRSFVTAATDPRGNVTTADYDAQGNQIRLKLRALRPFNPPTADTIDFAYDPHGQPTAITNAPDANGYRRVDAFSYYTNGPSVGQVQSIAIDEPGVQLTTTFEYDAHGNLTRCVDPRTNDWLFAYNALDQCVRAQSPPNISARCATDFAYDENNNLVSCTTQVRDAADNLVGTQVDRASYDSLHRLTECALAMDATRAQTNRFLYDGNSRCVQVLGPDAVSGADPLQNIRYLYDERGLLFCTLQPSSATCTKGTDQSYNLNGQLTLVAKTDIFCSSKADCEFRTYDGFGRLASVTDAMGNQTVCFHDANDKLKVVRHFGETNDVPGSAGNVRLAESRFEYDSLDRCAVVHDLHFNPATQSAIGDGEATTTFAYAANGACTSVTDDLGSTTTFGYDTAGRSTSAISAGAIAGIVVARDACGNVTSVTETNVSSFGGASHVLGRVYANNRRNGCVSSTDSAGNTNSCAYDSLGRVVRVTDALGNDTTYAYDLLGNCLACVSYAGSSSVQPATVVRTSQAMYDTSSRCLATLDANGNPTSYAYDSMGRCTTITQPDGTHEDLVWSPRSNLLQATDPNGTVRVCTYDLNDRLVQCDISTGGGGAGGALYVEAFTFDGCDRLTSHHDDDCDGDFAYDSLGNCVSETLNSLTTSSTYDALGNRLSLTYPGGRALTYAYDVASRCTGITESGQTLASFDYAGLDCVTRVTYGNGTRTLIGYDGLVSPPNAQGDYGFGQISQVRHVLTAGSTAFSGCKATWDQKQNKGARTVAIPGAGGRTNDMLFAYDALDQLTQSAVLEGTTVLRNTAYGFDRMGNRTNVTGAASCSGDYTMDLLSPPADFQMNQYTTTPCDSRTYDDNGNLLSRSSTAGAFVYAYDYADRLVAVQALVDDGAGGITNLPVASYAYDALGRRVSKTLNPGTLAATTRQYCYDGTCVIEERENSAVAASYVSSYMICYTVNSCLSMRLGTQDYFVHTDDQGNALALTSAQGAVVERYDCDDYGAVTFLTSDGTPTSDTSSAVGNPYCWGGLRLDAETGLQNDDGGGYFEPQAGRCLSRNIRTLKGIARYGGAYRSNPLSGGNNPWSGGGPVEMKTGTVKFFNEAKGFGMVLGGSGKTHTKTGHVTLMK